MKKKVKKVVKNMGRSSKASLDAAGNMLDVADKLGSAIKNVGKGKPIKAAKDVIKSFKSAGQAVDNNVKAIKLLAGRNHKEWYTKYDTQGLVNINLAIRKGSKFDALTLASSSGTTTYKQSVPSVASINIDLVKPLTDGDDWNQAINYMYATIRSANSGSVNYTPQQLEKYVYTVRAIHAAYCIARRAYNTLNNVSFYDTTTPISYYAAMGLDYDSFSENAANMREFGNKLSLQINKLVPLNCSLIDRTRWIYSNIFKDSDDLKAQRYLFRTNFLRAFSSNNEIGGFVVASNDLTETSTGIDYATFTTNISKLMAFFTNDGVFQVIAGDIIRAFGTNAVYPSEVWGENAAVLEIYDDKILTQIQNSTSGSGNVVATVGVDDNEWITNTLTYKFPFTGDSITPLNGYVAYAESPIINANVNQLDAGDTLSLTRLTARSTFKNIAEGYANFELTHCGTEVVLGIRTYNTGDEAVNKFGIVSDGPISSLRPVSTDDFSDAAVTPKSLFMWAAFDYAPMMYAVAVANGSYGRILSAMYDFNNFARVYSNNLNSYHGYATMSLLKVDRLARVNKTELLPE